MTTLNFNQKSFVDFSAMYYFEALGVKNVKLSSRIVNVGGTPTILVHVTGIQPSTGMLLNFDLWPKFEALESDIAALPKVIDDAFFRIGYWPEVDANGETHMREGSPKWISLSSGDREFKLSGEKREN